MSVIAPSGSTLRASALSIMAHVAIASVVVWGGAGLIEHRSAWAAEGRPAISWVALPNNDVQEAETLATPILALPVPTVVPPSLEPLNLDVPPPVMVTSLPFPLGSVQDSLPALLAGPAPDSVLGPVGVEEAASDNSAKKPRCGDLTEVHVSGSADSDPESDAAAREIFRPTPPHAPTTTAGAPPNDQHQHDVQFWIQADGRVTKIAVSPPIRDPDYRRRFREAVSTFVFGPVQTTDGRPVNYVYSCVVYPS